jgi:hypothetical protein
MKKPKLLGLIILLIFNITSTNLNAGVIGDVNRICEDNEFSEKIGGFTCRMYAYLIIENGFKGCADVFRKAFESSGAGALAVGLSAGLYCDSLIKSANKLHIEHR